MNEELQELADSFTNSAWEVWVERGGLDVVERELGPCKQPPESLLFVAAWKLGFAFALESVDEIASKMRGRN